MASVTLSVVADRGYFKGEEILAGHTRLHEGSASTSAASSKQTLATRVSRNRIGMYQAGKLITRKSFLSCRRWTTKPMTNSKQPKGIGSNVAIQAISAGITLQMNRSLRCLALISRTVMAKPQCKAPTKLRMTAP